MHTDEIETNTSRRRSSGLGLATVAGLAVVALGVGAAAQSDGSSDESSNGSDPQRSKQEAGSAEWRIEPESWIAVRYDTDGDGQYELMEYVFGLDLIQARERSEQRARDDDRGGMGSTQEASAKKKGSRSRGSARSEGDEARRRGMSSSRPAVFRVDGEVRTMKNLKLVGVENPHVMAVLETGESRTAEVDLGQAQGFSGADLGTGDRIEVIGSIGKVDGKALLIADRIRHDGETYEAERSDDLNLKRLKGEVRATRKVRYEGLDAEHMQVQLKVSEDRTVLVDLGPASKLSGHDLSEGTSLKVLADSVRIGDADAFRAEQIRSGGKTVSLDRSWERENYRQKKDW